MTKQKTCNGNNRVDAHVRGMAHCVGRSYANFSCVIFRREGENDTWLRTQSPIGKGIFPELFNAFLPFTAPLSRHLHTSSQGKLLSVPVPLQAEA